MKRTILASAVLLLVACGSTGNGVTVGTATGRSGTSPAATDASSGSTPASDAGSSDTINVETFGDMPPECISLLTQFLKQIEPVVSTVDWDKATLSEFESLGQQFATESNAFDTQTAAAGCDKYNLTGSDEAQLQQMADLAAAEAPGTVGFIKFLGSLATSASTTGSIPADCAGIIAEIEPYLAKGSTMKDLTVAEVTRFGQLMTGVSTGCTAEEAAAFFARADITAFIST